MFIISGERSLSSNSTFVLMMLLQEYLVRIGVKKLTKKKEESIWKYISVIPDQDGLAMLRVALGTNPLSAVLMVMNVQI